MKEILLVLLVGSLSSTAFGATSAGSIQSDEPNICESSMTQIKVLKDLFDKGLLNYSPKLIDKIGSGCNLQDQSSLATGCNGPGGSCSISADCCGSEHCQGGTCDSGAGCNPSGSTCAENYECCSYSCQGYHCN